MVWREQGLLWYKRSVPFLPRFRLPYQNVDLIQNIDTLKKTEVTGNEDIDGVQRSVGETVGDTLGSNGIAGVVGDGLDKGVLRGNV